MIIILKFDIIIIIKQQYHNLDHDHQSNNGLKIIVAPDPIKKSMEVVL